MTNAITKVTATPTPAKGKAPTPTPATPETVATPAPAPAMVAVCGPFVSGQRHVKASGQLYLPAIAPYAEGKACHPQLGEGKVSGHRAYAVATFKALANAQPQGFTLDQASKALAGNVLATLGHPLAGQEVPRGGWAKHNMATWAAGQGWLLPAIAPAPAKV